MFAETVMTLTKAVKMKRREKYDILHLRDGEPFIFLPFLISLPHRGIKWAISMTAAIVFKPKLRRQDIIRRPYIWLYTTALYFWVNSTIWKPLYRACMKYNRYTLMPQNSLATEAYKDYLGGVFAEHIECVELGVSNNGRMLDKKVARELLGLPQDAFIALSFGAPHSGKDMNTIFDAISHCPRVFLVHGGTHTFSLGSNPIELTKAYRLDGRVKLFNRYIPNEEHPPFFSAADVAVLSYTKAFASTSSMVWESAKYRLPMISSDANTLGEMVKQYGLGVLFEAENPTSLAETIEEYRKLPPSSVETLKSNCENFAFEHSDARWAEKCTAVYRRLLNEV